MQGPIAKGLGTAFYGPILAFTEQVNVRYWPIEALREGLQPVKYVASKEVVNV